MLRRGEVLNNTYEVIEEIGQGGSGVVYLAYHLRLQKRIVIKKIKDDYDGRINERAEADILKQLHHMYLPQVYDFVQMERSVFTVMDYIEGCDLLKYIKSGQRFSERQIVIWLRQLCEVLEYLHRQNPPIIHSDIKPSNIMVTPEGNICLIDFNISFGDSGGRSVSGYSQRYASPEQIYRSHLVMSGQDPREILVDNRTDIFSLGASFYHLMTGCFPAADGRMSRPLRDYDLPYSSWLCELVDKMMRINPNERYQSASEVLGDLLSINERDEDYRRVKTGEKIVFIAGLLLIVAGVVCTAFGWRQITREHFQKECETLKETALTDDYDATVTEGIELLNNKKYKTTLAESPEEKGDILYMIANSYFEQDDYTRAIGFYEDALAYNEANPEYYRDYGIALARKGEIEKAEKALEQAVERDLGESQIYLVQAEIALAKGDYTVAVNCFRQAIDGTEDDYDKSRGYILCARAYRAMGDYKGEVEILTEAEQMVSEKRLPAILRALGAASTRYGAQVGGDDGKACYQKAQSCYETLLALPNPTFNDGMNLAVIRQVLGDYEGARQQLLSMQQTYPDDYRIYMKLALLECVIQGTLDENSRNYQQAESYYQQAENYYEPKRNSGESDEEMQNLESVIQDLYAKGWLQS